jgi:hypothetical protein
MFPEHSSYCKLHHITLFHLFIMATHTNDPHQMV